MARGSLRTHGRGSGPLKSLRALGVLDPADDSDQLSGLLRAVHRLFERAQTQGDADNRGDYQAQH